MDDSCQMALYLGELNQIETSYDYLNEYVRFLESIVRE